ncbi:MAG: gliding motility-associated C-terminal domain-containing protein [Saprospiraceae bacterium]|nr:gliding motility-associated C-terminal domain-containing protein [Saprospiraceae bacterium]
MDDEAIVDADQLSTSIAVTENDDLPNEPGDEWQISSALMPTGGSLSQGSNGDFVFTLDNPDAYGQDSFTYKVCHEVCTTLCDTANVLISIERDCFEESEEERVNVFTPNGDDINPEFDPLEPYRLAGCVPSDNEAELTVVNRWGEAVFRAAPYRAWDGTNNGGAKLPQGAYYYFLKVKTREKTLVVKGAVNLILDK